jgi:hypothetical protein
MQSISGISYYQMRFLVWKILEKARLSIHVGDLHGTQPITLRTAVYETRTYGGVRGALRQFLAEPSTRLVAVFL